MPRWRNGRRARFRCECREACRFESYSGHFKRSFLRRTPFSFARIGLGQRVAPRATSLAWEYIYTPNRYATAIKQTKHTEQINFLVIFHLSYPTYGRLSYSSIFARSPLGFCRRSSPGWEGKVYFHHLPSPMKGKQKTLNSQNSHDSYPTKKSATAKAVAQNQKNQKPKSKKRRQRAHSRRRSY